MPKIFISYRREDSKHAVGRLHAALTRHVRNPKRDIFIDIDNIPRGVDFVDHLDGQVAQCDVMLAVIGPGWLTATDAKTGKRRLDDPHDFVRIEVASALKRGIPVVPVVLDDTRIPSGEDLPEDLRLLARRNGERLEHESFAADVTRLIKNLPASDAKSTPTSSHVVKPAAGRGGWIAPTVTFAVVALSGGGAWAWFANPGDWRGAGIEQVGADSAAPTPLYSGNPTAPSVTPAEPTPTSGPAVSDTKAKSQASASTATPDGSLTSPGGVSPTAGIGPTAAPSGVGASPSTLTLDIKLDRTLGGHVGPVSRVAYSPDGARIASLGSDKTLRLWDAKTGRTLGVFSDGLTDVPSSVVYTRDGSRILVTAGRVAQVRDASTGVVLKTFDADSRPNYMSKYIYNGDFSPDGSRVVTGFVAGSAIWETATGNLVVELIGSANVTSVAYSPDGSHVATGADDRTTRIWDAHTGQEIAKYTHNSYANYVAFSPDGSRVAGGGPGLYDFRVRDVSTGKSIATFKGHTSSVSAIRFSSDGSKIVSVDLDGLRIWKTANGQLLGKTNLNLDNQDSKNSDAALSPDGTQIVSAGDDGLIRVWGIKPK